MVTRRFPKKIMSTELDKAQAKSLRYWAEPTFEQLKNAAAEATKKHYLSFQYKIVDMAKPLLALRGAFESEGKLGILLGGLARI